MGTRRPDGTGTIYQSKSRGHYWHASIQVEGKRKSFSAKTREDVEKKLAEALEHLNQGDPIMMKRQLRQRGTGSIWQDSRTLHWKAGINIGGERHYFFGMTKAEALKKLNDFLGPRRIRTPEAQELERLAQKEHLAAMHLKTEEQLLEARTILKRVQNGSDERLSAQGFFKKHPTSAD